ncbi:MAG: DUF4249 family protein [Saprospiraceae bacterium]
MLKQYILYSIAIIFSLAACNLEQEIDLQLPEYNAQVAVECYLEPGEPFTVLLTRSAGYFDAFPTLDESLVENLLEQDAEVSITLDTTTYVLENEIGFNVFTGKIYNYSNGIIVPENYDDDFVLNITTKDGETITSTTQLLTPVVTDSIVVEFDENIDTLARLLSYFSDDPTQENWYRRMVHKGTLDSLEFEFALNDQFVDDGNLVFGTGFDYVEGDTIFSTLFHITEEYHDFLESIGGALDANGNPFGQPSSILSNVTGTADPIGIFTGLARETELVIIQK